jgi:hypothetical protein
MPEGFGRRSDVQWTKPANAQEEGFVAAARLQHRYVLRIRERMAAERLNSKAYAARSGTSVQRLLRILRGEVILRLEDIALADAVLGQISEFAVYDADRARKIAVAQRDVWAEIVRSAVPPVGVASVG